MSLHDTTQIIVTTGPESSGKTTLANELSKLLSAPLVQEASRGYLQALYQRKPGSRYQQSDLLQIAQLQVQQEQAALVGKPPQLVCDTDLLVIMIWSEVVYGNCEPALLKLFENSLHLGSRSYLLCDHHIPWEPDPLRENPNDRDRLFHLYQEKLIKLGLPFLHVQGDKTQRLCQVTLSYSKS